MLEGLILFVLKNKQNKTPQTKTNSYNLHHSNPIKSFRGSLRIPRDLIIKKLSKEAHQSRGCPLQQNCHYVWVPEPYYLTHANPKPFQPV